MKNTKKPAESHNMSYNKGMDLYHEEIDMNTMKKTMCIMSLTLPFSMAYAATEGSDSPSDSLDPINEITVSAGNDLAITGGTISSEAGSFTTETITLALANNSQFGYTVQMKSSNGGLLSDATGASASADGDFLNIKWTCTSPVGPGSETIVTTNNANVDLAADTYATMLEITSPSVATANGTSICTSALVTGETVADLLTNPNSGEADNYTTTLTFKIVNKTS